MDEQHPVIEQTPTSIVSRSGPLLETPSLEEASTSTSTRLASEREQDPKGMIGPWATRIQVIINQDTARAFQKYMADHNDFRPGKIIGSLLSEFLIAGSYLAKPAPPKCKHEEIQWFRSATSLVKKCAKCGVPL